MHREAGELETFDRVIANPPFSQNYTRSNMEFPERFRWGWCPTSGKKADLMFAQHMLAVCKEKGMVCTVMPHGVLFRGSAEKEIRSNFLKHDLIEAVIGLPPNLFYGAGIPACLLVMRPNRTGRSPNPNKHPTRRGKVLFINADAEFYAGRAQNYLHPQHIEKIASTFERYEDVPGYARIVPLDEIKDAANDFNLNIRRYVDNSPPPEPHDVRAHLVGGVPTAEIDAHRPLTEALGFDVAHAFDKRKKDDRYRDFAPAIAGRGDIAPRVEQDPGVAARVQAQRDALAAWWSRHAKRLADLPERRDLNAVRSEMLASFSKAMLPAGVLDHFQLAGVVAAWWTEQLPDLKTLIENGFAGVIDGWVDAIADAVEDDDGVGPAFDPFRHKLVLRLMADYLQRIEDAKADIARLKGEKEAFEQSNPPDDADEDELAAWNYVKDIERQARDLAAEHREELNQLKRLQKAILKPRVKDKDKQLAAALTEKLKPVIEQIEAHNALLEPYEKIKADLAEGRRRNRELLAQFVAELQARCEALSERQQQALVLELLAADLQAGLDSAVSGKRQSLIRFLEGLWDKYSVPLSDLQRARDRLQESLAEMMGGLGYVG